MGHWGRVLELTIAFTFGRTAVGDSAPQPGEEDVRRFRRSPRPGGVPLVISVWGDDKMAAFRRKLNRSIPPRARLRGPLMHGRDFLF